MHTLLIGVYSNKKKKTYSTVYPLTSPPPCLAYFIPYCRLLTVVVEMVGVCPRGVLNRYALLALEIASGCIPPIYCILRNQNMGVGWGVFR